MGMMPRTIQSSLCFSTIFSSAISIFFMQKAEFEVGGCFVAAFLTNKMVAFLFLPFRTVGLRGSCLGGLHPAKLTCE